jgi:hypothetical protein
LVSDLFASLKGTLKLNHNSPSSKKNLSRMEQQLKSGTKSFGGHHDGMQPQFRLKKIVLEPCLLESFLNFCN